MRREAGYQRTIKDLRNQIEQMGNQMTELRASVKVLLEVQAERSAFNNDSLKKASQQNSPFLTETASSAIHHLY